MKVYVFENGVTNDPKIAKKENAKWEMEID